MVATSHPLATRAGLRALERGGNAVDAALAAAAVLTVAEPTDNGVGGDAFALVWDGQTLHGLNGSGRSPAELDGREAAASGPQSVTVPGAVRLWADLAERFGTARARRRGRSGGRSRGRAASPARRASLTSGRRADLAPWPAPGLGRPLPAARARGAPCAASRPKGRTACTRARWPPRSPPPRWLSEDDLAAHRSEWVEPLRRSYRGVEVLRAAAERAGRRGACSRSRSTRVSSRGCTRRSRR